MAIYRTVSMSFWTDSKVVDEFTPEDKYFYLYLFTNPHTNLCGCYELSIKQVELETGYSKDAIYNLIKRFESVHDVVRYSKKTKEILLINWNKYNWTTSDKFRKPLAKELENIKDKKFREYLVSIFNGENKRYPIDTNCIDTSVTVTVTDTDTVSNNKDAEEKSDLEKALEDFVKHRKKLKSPMTDRAYELMLNKLEKLSGGNEKKKIEIINQSIENGWKGVFELRQSRPPNKFNNAAERSCDMNELEFMLLQSN